MTNSEELAWAAGFFDGEGSIGTYPAGRYGKPRIDISLSQTDPQVLERFRNVLSVGKVYGPYNQKNINANPYWMYMTSTSKSTKIVVDKLIDFVSPIKRQQMIEATDKYDMLNAAYVPKRKGPEFKERCVRGHEYSNIIVYKDGTRQCLDCVWERRGRLSSKPGPQRKTECRRDHGEEFAYYEKDGHRRCAKCRQLRRGGQI
jgi:hypothetical protein